MQTRWNEPANPYFKQVLPTNDDKHSEYDFSAPHSVTHPKFVQNFFVSLPDGPNNVGPFQWLSDLRTGLKPSAKSTFQTWDNQNKSLRLPWSNADSSPSLEGNTTPGCQKLNQGA